MRVLVGALLVMSSLPIQAFEQPIWCSTRGVPTVADQTVCTDALLAQRFIQLDKQWDQYKATQSQDKVAVGQAYLNTWVKSYYHACSNNKPCINAAIELALNAAFFNAATCSTDTATALAEPTVNTASATPTPEPKPGSTPSANVDNKLTNSAFNPPSSNNQEPVIPTKPISIPKPEMAEKTNNTETDALKKPESSPSKAVYPVKPVNKSTSTETPPDTSSKPEALAQIDTTETDPFKQAEASPSQLTDPANPTPDATPTETLPKTDAKPPEVGNKETNTASDTAKNSASYKTTSIQLYNDYDANEVATDAKINGRPVEVDGKIEAIDKDFMEVTVIKLETGSAFISSRFKLKDSEKDTAVKLQKGDRVLIRCEHMKRTMGGPLGTDCVFAN